MKNKPVLIKQ